MQILVFPFNLLSHYLRCITAVQRYFPQDEVCFASSSKYDSFLKLHGYISFAYQGPDVDMIMQQSNDFKFDWLNEKYLNDLLNEQLEIIEQYKPDLVIGDMSPTLKIAAEISGVKYISIINAYMTRYYAPVRPLSRRHFAYKYQQRTPQWIFDSLIQKMEAQSHVQVHAPYRSLRKRLGLKPMNTFLQEYEGDETWICDEVKYFPLKQLPESVRVIGPLIYEEKAPKSLPEGLFSKEKPNILVSMGSSGAWEELRFLEKCEEYNIIALGDNEQRLKGPHIKQISFYPMGALLAKSDVFICHGGNGSIYQALENEVPMVFFTSHFEQEWNVAQMLQWGKGICGDDWLGEDKKREELKHFLRKKGII